MALNVPTFFKRLGSSVVFVAIMLTGLLWNEWSFLALVCLINALCLRDFFRLMQKIVPGIYWPRWLPALTQGICIASFLTVATLNAAWYGNDHLYLFATISSYLGYLWVLLPVIPAFIMLSGFLSEKMFFQAMLLSIGGLLYITVPMFMLLHMCAQDFLLPLVLTIMIWSNDTMAYLVGSFFGKHPFSPISPKKTWEGTIGGAAITIIAAGAIGHYTHKFRIVDWMALALCATVAGTFGDLLESKLKRIADVKDSGNLMPGHGGALDRFDSLLIAIPFAFVYVIYFMK